MKRQTKSKPVLAALGLSRGKMRLRVIPCDWDSPILFAIPEPRNRPQCNGGIRTRRGRIARCRSMVQEVSPLRPLI